MPGIGTLRVKVSKKKKIQRKTCMKYVLKNFFELTTSSPWRTTKDLWFSYVFRGDWKRQVAWNGLRKVPSHVFSSVSPRKIQAFPPNFLVRKFSLDRQFLQIFGRIVFYTGYFMDFFSYFFRILFNNCFGIKLTIVFWSLSM